MGKRSVLVAIGLLLVACGEPPPPAPSAVIVASPEAVCIGDEFETTITLDASDSAPYLTLVYVPPAPDAPALDFSWTFTGSEKTFIDGNAHSAELSLAMKGDRPLHVTLEVENSVGGVSSITKTIAVTPLDEDGNCPLPIVEE
jgi:hypothetical protein